MPKRLHIKKGDTVEVLAGDSKGRQGKVLSVDRKKSRAIVESVNMVKKHTKPNAEHPQGGIIEKEASIHISNLNVVCPEAKKPTRLGRKQDKDGNWVFYSKKSKLQEEIK